MNESANEPELIDTPASAMLPEDVKCRMERLRHILDRVGERLDDIVTEAVEGIENVRNSGKNNGDSVANIKTTKAKQIGKFREKHFQLRNSLLTDLFDGNIHLRSVYNIWAAIFFLLFIHTMSHDLAETGTVKFGMKTIFAGFAQFPQVIRIWILMTLSLFGVYVCHSFWAHQRQRFQPNSQSLKMWDYSWLLIFISYQMMLLILPGKVAFSAKFPPPSAIVITMEQTRMMMKVHAFVRTTSPAVLAHKPHTEGRELIYPNFSKFLYFLFAPTLIYRDNYPRTKIIRWNFVLFHFVEVIFVIFFVSFIHERFILPTYSDYGLEPFTIRNFVTKFFNSVLPAMGMFLCGFYCLLHAWFNAWAELLKFGDRLFYKDWWTSTSFDTYYRKWNLVVHDWLYTYLYKDVYEIVFPGNRFLATGSVFAVSAVFHEYILTVSFRLFHPVMFFLFGFVGYFLVYLTRKTPQNFANLLFWLLMSLGNGMLLTFYTMEYFARVNCPRYEGLLPDSVIPRSLLCNGTAQATR